MRQVGIPEPERRFGQYPHQLSGGMRQRVMIAMAMIMKPDLLIADEPTTALDVSIEAQILRLMRDLQRQHGTSILMITHNLGVVAELCDEVYVMYAGEVVERADVYTLFSAPAHPYTRGLLSAIPIPDVHRVRRGEIPEGEIPDIYHLPEGCKYHTRCPRATDLCRKKRPASVTVEGDHEVACHLIQVSDH
jgi:oligopeptide/dipeptide ABC transporter ATP-binding protein